MGFNTLTKTARNRERNGAEEKWKKNSWKIYKEAFLEQIEQLRHDGHVVSADTSVGYEKNPSVNNTKNPKVNPVFRYGRDGTRLSYEGGVWI